MSHVTINQGAINHFFDTRSLGTMAGGKADTARLVARMVQRAQRNASGKMLEKRTGVLEASVRPIIRLLPHGGVEVGVGSTAPYADYLESGTQGPYKIPKVARKKGEKMLKSLPNHPPNRHPLLRPRKQVTHPGIEAKHWLREAVISVVFKGA